MNSYILSPHYDDAVFSCYHLLSNQTTIINIFSGIPDKTKKTTWDIVCGNFNSHNLMKMRKRENDLAVSKYIKNTINLNYLDRQYNDNRPDKADILNRLKDQISSKNDIIYAPLAIGNIFSHPDHILIRKVALDLIASHYKVIFYADFPYMKMTLFDLSKQKIKIEKKINSTLHLNGTIKVIKLTKQQQIEKMTLMKAYKTQYFTTNLLSLGRLSSKLNLCYEIEYKVE